MKLSDQQERAIELIDSGANAFLTGSAGTGKSTVMTAALGRSRRKTDMCATTGIAALNLQQQFKDRTGLLIKTHTIYRYAGIMLGPNPGQAFEDYFAWLESKMTRSRRAAFARVARAEQVIIDEVSMLPGRVLSYLDYHFRRIRGIDAPFGGVQMVFVGDFLQLPPVAKTGVYDWSFQSASWQALNPLPLYLSQAFRQNEPEFIDALNDFRIGRVRGETAAALAKRVARFPSRDIPRLFTHNAQVDKWNKYQLECIEDHASHFFKAKTEGDPTQIEFLTNNLVTPEVLELRRSARVMFTANITVDGELVAANGECGTVLDMNPDSILIKKDNGIELSVAPNAWSYDPQSEDSATFTQFPLRLAYSMTIHKSQGLTLDRALIDIRAAREPGQAYVALSRLRSLSGLHLKDWFSGVFVSNEAIEFYKRIERESVIATSSAA